MQINFAIFQIFAIFAYTIKQNIMTPNLTFLYETYKAFNVKYFNNELPNNLPIELSARLTRCLGKAYYTRRYNSYERKYEIIARRIKISTHYNFLDEKQVANVLCHEMVHIWQYVNNKADGHGYWFQWKAKEIAKSDPTMIITIKHNEEINGVCESKAEHARVIVWTHKDKFLFSKVNPNKTKYFAEELVNYLRGDTKVFGIFDAYGSRWGEYRTCQKRLTWYEYSETKFMDKIYPTLKREVA